MSRERTNKITLKIKEKYMGKPAQCHSVHHKSHTGISGTETAVRSLRFKTT
jgi:hypothetical protein